MLGGVTPADDDELPPPTKRPTSPVEAVLPEVVPLPRRRADGTPLGSLERKVVDGVDGERTVADLAKLAGLSNGEMGLVVARLAELGVVLLPEHETAIVAEEIDRGWTESLPPSSRKPTEPPPDQGKR
jgi:hypothetical protein